MVKHIPILIIRLVSLLPFFFQVLASRKEIPGYSLTKIKQNLLFWGDLVLCPPAISQNCYTCIKALVTNL